MFDDHQRSPHDIGPHDMYPHDSDVLDQAIRRQLDASLPSAPPPTIVLDQLRRPLRRARMIRHTQLAVGAAAALTFLGGAAQLAPRPSNETIVIAATPTTTDVAATVASVADQATSGATTTDPATNETGLAAPVPSSGTVVPQPPTSPLSSTTNTSLGTTAVTITSSTTVAEAPTTTTSVADTNTTDTNTTGTNTTGTNTSPSPTTITSVCGTVTATADGNRIELVATQPAAGYLVTIDHDGPEELELTMSGPDGRCEIKAHAHDGRVIATSEFDPSTDHDEHED